MMNKLNEGVVDQEV